MSRDPRKDRARKRRLRRRNEAWQARELARHAHMAKKVSNMLDLAMRMPAFTVPFDGPTSLIDSR